MPTPLKRVFIAPLDPASRVFVDKLTGVAPVAGDCFYAPHLFDQSSGRFSPGYWQDYTETQRPPVVVVLPGGKWWCVDELSYTPEKGYHGDGWVVTGSIETDPVSLTVRPSVNTAGYHGTLIDGVLSDDLGDHARDVKT
jgi:hypothetical protein